ncbi:MAG: glycosyltransferase [Nitrospinota bacterium]
MGKKSKGKKKSRKPAAGRPAGVRSAIGRRLRITYLMATTNVTGGAKVIFEHVNRLTDRGHQVQVVSHQGPPQWMPLRAPLIRADVRTPLSSMVPPSDVVVATYWNHARFGLHAVRLLDAVPVYFVQGDEYFYERFEDGERAGYQKASDDSYGLPMKRAVVSPVIGRILRERYGAESVFVPAAVDERVFRPRRKPRREKPLILVMGTDQLEFKGVRDAFAALQKARDAGRDFDVLRVSAYPQANFDFPCRYVERPTQEELGRLFAVSDLMVTASYYESFPLPPLEAMASGTPVVTTGNEGVRTYAEDGKNCLMVPVRDPDALAEAVVELLDHPARGRELAEAGRETASRYRWDRIIDDWERQLLSWVEEPRPLELAPAETRRPPLEEHLALMGPTLERLARVRLEEGEALHGQGQAEKAKVLFEEAQTLRPDWVEPRVNRAVLAWEAGDTEGALALLEEARRMAPDHPDVLANLAFVLAQSGRAAEALWCAGRYLAQRPDDAEMQQLEERLQGLLAQSAGGAGLTVGQAVAN